MSGLPQLLKTTAKPKPWGVLETEPWYPNPKEATGEIWFHASASVPLLVKLLFTSDNLSVQVHPEDEYAKKHHDCAGKTEMWHILKAESHGRVALGLKEPVHTEEELREACETGRIEHMLNWVPAKAGDTFFTPAGTIHAIGGGLVLCEVQQFSDITYRLYDWGSDRELHLDHGIRVSHRHAHSHQPELLAKCRYFRTELLEVTDSVQCASPVKNTIYVALEGKGTIAGLEFQQGQAWEVPAHAEPFEISGKSRFLTTRVP